MSTASACPIKTHAVTTKVDSGNFDTRIGGAVTYQLNKIVNSSDDCSFKNDQFIDQHRRTTLPAPHLLLQSSDNEHSSSVTNSHPHSNGHYPTILNYGNSVGVSLPNRESPGIVKQTNFMNFPSAPRSNYNNYTRTNRLNSPPFDLLSDPIAFTSNTNNNNISNGNNNDNNDPSNNYQLVNANGFHGWNPNSQLHDLKIDSRCDYRNQLNSDTQQQLINQESFSLLSPNDGTKQVYTNMNRCVSSSSSSSCTATPRLEDHSNQSLHISAASLTPLTVHHFDTMNYHRNIEDRTYTNISASSSNSVSIVQNTNPMVLNCENKQSTVANRRSRASVLGTKESPVNYAVAMTPDSSTTGFTTSKFACSSDDGETSPTPTCGSECPPGQSRKPAPTLATGRRNLKGELVDPDEADRRMKRRERNRKSAQKCRERKVQRTHELQSQVECLQLEASRLMQELDGWRTRARQCVALLQHHCPGVSLPYLSCLNESPASMNGFKEPVDSLVDIMAFEKAVNQESVQGGWKSKQPRKPYATNGVTNTNTFGSNESSTILPPVDQLHTYLTPNRSKSLFGFPLNASDTNESLSYPSVSESSTVSPSNPECNIIVSQQLPMTRSTSVASMLRGPASDSSSSSSSSSSCSTYELSFPMESQTHYPSTLGNFKQYQDTNSLQPRLNSQGITENSPVNVLPKPISLLLNEANNKQASWDLEIDDKNSMDCTVLSPTLKKTDCAMLMDRKSTVVVIDCDSEMTNHSKPMTKLEGACYS